MPPALGTQEAGGLQTLQFPVAQQSPPAGAEQSWRETGAGWAWGLPESGPEPGPEQRRRSYLCGCSLGTPDRGQERRRLKGWRRGVAGRSEEAMLRGGGRMGWQEKEEVCLFPLEVSVELPMWRFLWAGRSRKEEEEW